MARRKRPDWQDEELQEMVTTKIKSREHSRETVTLLYTTEKHHSRFLVPHITDYDPDSSLNTGGSVVRIQLEKRIKLGHWSTPSIPELVSALESLIPSSSMKEEQLLQHDTEQLSKAKAKSKSKKMRESKQYAAINLYLQSVAHKHIISQVKVKPKTLKKWIQLLNKGQLFKQPAYPSRQLLRQKYLDAISSFLSHPSECVLRCERLKPFC